MWYSVVYISLNINTLLCYTLVSVLVLGIARGQYYWILDIGCLAWYCSNTSEHVCPWLIELWVVCVYSGWRREVVHRGVSSRQQTSSSSKPTVDIYYFSPSNNKLVSTVVIIYLQGSHAFWKVLDFFLNFPGPGFSRPWKGLETKA